MIAWLGILWRWALGQNAELFVSETWLRSHRQREQSGGIESVRWTWPIQK